jgi:hypothetical protein
VKFDQPQEQTQSKPTLSQLSVASGRNGWKAVIAAASSRIYALTMLWNIIDNRERRYRWKIVNAIVEAVEHDNSCADADQAPESDPSKVVLYDALEAVSVNEAITWAMEQSCPVTLYLYDEGKGFDEDVHFNEMEVRFESDEDDQQA